MKIPLFVMLICHSLGDSRESFSHEYFYRLPQSIDTIKNRSNISSTLLRNADCANVDLVEEELALFFKSLSYGHHFANSIVLISSHIPLYLHEIIYASTTMARIGIAALIKSDSPAALPFLSDRSYDDLSSKVFRYSKSSTSFEVLDIHVSNYNPF
jgi:hypothetical protein